MLYDLLVMLYSKQHLVAEVVQLCVWWTRCLCHEVPYYGVETFKFNDYRLLHMIHEEVAEQSSLWTSSLDQGLLLVMVIYMMFVYHCIT